MIEQLLEASKDGISLLSDTKMKQMIPPQMKKMTDRYKKCVNVLTVLVLGIFLVAIMPSLPELSRTL